MAYIDINDVESTFAGLATAANQLIEISLLTSIDSKTPTLGQKTMAGSSPVVIASDQSTIPVNFTDTLGNTIGTPANPIFVEFPANAARNSVNQYNEVLAVASGSTTTVVTYTVPPATSVALERISGSGGNIALYTILLNGTPIDTQRTYFGGALNVQFEFMSTANLGLILSAGDIISMTILHDRPYVANFEGRIQLTELV